MSTLCILLPLDEDSEAVFLTQQTVNVYNFGLLTLSESITLKLMKIKESIKIAGWGTHIHKIHKN